MLVACPRNHRYLQREGLGFWGPLALYGRAEHRREIALQFDSEDACLRRQSDGVDQPSECLPGLGTRFCGLQGMSERRHLLAVQLGHLRVEDRRWVVGGVEL